MKGDFSWFDHRPLDNYTGVLEQQGRVRLDRDGNAAEEIARSLRTLMGRDAFGPGRVAVPAEESDSFRITAASATATGVEITCQPGRVWVDGIPLLLGQETTATATHLPPPFQPAPGPVAAGTRDAVILEVWEDAVSAFQDHQTLLEPALGGVDTTGRVRVCHRLRLRRLGDDEDCATIGPSLRDDLATIGRLTVTPSPAVTIAGDCPVEAGGGYTGDGHRLYCIEVAAPRGGGTRFVWSRLGGGLMGRGRFDPVAGTIAITHNRAMIDAAGVSGFLLQALERDGATGCWRVAFEATVSMTDDLLTVTDPIGTWPAAAGNHAVFRLWDGVGDIADFDDGPTDLADGIRLEFSPVAPGGTNYREGDRWLFQARTAGTEFDPSTWPDNALPQAIRYHRAPLGIVTWASAPPVEASADDIDDCRDSFPPLTDPCHCCTITVGDGRSTHGDEDSIEAAIDRLPAAGGRICLLPGLHQTNAVISERGNIRIEGCGKHTRVIPREGARDMPIFHVIDSECIELVDMEMISLAGVAVLAEEIEDGALRQFGIARNRIVACTRAVQVEGGTEIVIRENRIRMLDKAGAGVAVYLAAEDSRIEDNDIGVVPAEATPRPPEDPDTPDQPEDPNDPCADADLVYANIGFLIGFVEFVFGFTLTAIVPPPYRALGGIQIGAGAERVGVLDNRITGGAGNGITLGGSHLPPQGEDGGGGPLTQSVNLGRSVIAIRGTVIGPDGEAAAGVTLRIAPPTGDPRSFTTSAAGEFAIEGTGQQGSHTFSSVSAGFGIDSAEIVQIVNFGMGSLVLMQITLNRQQTGPDPRLAFVYGIRIEDNDITAMGLNGIGIPPALEVIAPDRETPSAGTPTDRLTARAADARFALSRAAAVNPLLALLGHPAIDLTILNNRITGNLRTPFTAAMRDAARLTGFGGISLGLAETVTVSGNRIEDNGRRHIDPVCGIFILYGEQVEITDNLIRDNGVFVNLDEDIVQGQRGGIAGIFASVGLDDFGAADNRGALTVKPALRIHDNVVQHPQGRTLTLLAAGPVSIVANHLTAERSGPQALDLIAGTVLLISLSGIGRLPSGGCLIQANQIALGPDSNAFTAVALAAGEDLSLDANQIDALQAGFPVGDLSLMMNTLIFARTIRATGNRFREPLRAPERALQVSLIALSTAMNVTTSNQGDHCIYAFDQSMPPRLVDTANLEFDTTFCPEMRDAAAGAARNPVLGTANLASLSFVAGLAQPQGTGRTFATGLDRNLAAINAYRAERVTEAAEYKIANAALLGNEIARLEAKPLVRSDILAANRARLATISRDVDRIRAAGEIADTRPEPATEEAGVVIQGRVTDARGNGILQASVQLSDARGRAIDLVEPVRTNGKGAYRLGLAAAQMREIGEALARGATMVATLEAEEIRPARSEVFRIDGGAILVPDIVFVLATDSRPTRPEPNRPDDDTGRGPTDRLEPPLLRRPVLTPSNRLRSTSGRIAPLLRSGRNRGTE
ncbi:DUF6519 domain-containing protein [Rhodovulum euryhalinum]|uniref:Parallel beta helix pectate lyase-like protein n=1 Tax=Rhodovulum euryhalinum TaxID=35805 RepID=A0A4R2KTS8_9RHOB|nr:DUF6519 domain-containing protein [Rhodovulum euryhalinum]TCO70105.1 parallel beta helix pectate lyase-like protein [Rhodovulum euryhalinum]